MKLNRFAVAALTTMAAMTTVATMELPVQAETLKTHNFKVTVTRNCPQGYVVCNNVTYNGTDLKTGKSIRLQGKTLHATCADRVTPCRFIGYEFRNKNYRYVVTESGWLRIYQGGKLLLQEQGAWNY